MEVKNIADMNGEEISRLSQKELKKVVKTLNSRIRSRLYRLGKTETPATVAFNKRGGLKTIRKMTLNQLRNYYISQSQFLNAKTSTLTGYARYATEFAKMTGYDPKKIDDFWEFYDKYMEANQHTAYQVQSDTRLRAAALVLKENMRMSETELFEKMNKVLERAAENFRAYDAYGIPDVDNQDDYEYDDDDFNDYFGGF